MTDGLKFKLDGLIPLERELSRLGLKAERKTAIKALRRGAKPLVEETKRIVRKKTRTLEKSIGIATIPKKFQGAAIAVLARKGRKYKNNGWYAHLVEFGTRHSQPRPFMRPAFESKKLDVIAEVVKALKEDLKI